MSIELEYEPLAPRIAALLSSLRLRIRSYVWTEGLAAIVVTLGIAFWLSLAFDWLFEPPWQVRAAMLVMTGVAVLVVANRLIFSRVFRPIDDTNLAVVLERRFRDYHDSLLTTVELNTQSAHRAGFNQQMLDDTRRQAVERSQHDSAERCVSDGPAAAHADWRGSAISLGVIVRRDGPRSVCHVA